MEELQKVISHFEKQIRMDCRDKNGNPSAWTGRDFGDYTLQGVDISTGVLRVNLNSGSGAMWYEWSEKFELINENG